MLTRWMIPATQLRTQHEDGQWLVFDDATGEMWQVTQGVADVLESLDEGWQPGAPLPPRLQPFNLAPADASALVADLVRQGLVVDAVAAKAFPRPRRRRWYILTWSIWRVPALSPGHWRLMVTVLAAAAVASAAILWTDLPVFPGQGRIAFLAQSFRGALLTPVVSKRSFGGLLACWVLLSAVHELAHAFTLTSRTGKPVEVGLRLMFGWPRPFANVTALVTLARRSDRIPVLLAGSFAEFAAWLVLLAALGERVVALGLPFVLLGPIVLLANLVPLMRNDGYLLLQELTGDRDLMRTARRAAHRAFVVADPQVGRPTRWWLPWYGLFELALLPATVVLLGLFLGVLVSYPTAGVVSGFVGGAAVLSSRLRGIDTEAGEWTDAHAA